MASILWMDGWMDGRTHLATARCGMFVYYYLRTYGARCSTATLHTSAHTLTRTHRHARTHGFVIIIIRFVPALCQQQQQYAKWCLAFH